MSVRLTKLLELHLVHDPDKGEVAVEMLAAAGEERVRYTVKGRYGDAKLEPTATLVVDQPTYDDTFSDPGWRRTLPLGPALARVGLDCRRLEVLEMKRERLPAEDVT